LFSGILHALNMTSIRKADNWKCNYNLSETKYKPHRWRLLKSWWTGYENQDQHRIFSCTNATILANCIDVPNPAHKSIGNTRHKLFRISKILKLIGKESKNLQRNSHSMICSQNLCVTVQGWNATNCIANLEAESAYFLDTTQQLCTRAKLPKHPCCSDRVSSVGLNKNQVT
jgi:hypothetical protein